MKSIEISARTVSEAVELALEQLKRDRDDVAIEVLDTGDEGEEAFIRVTVVEDEEPNVPPPTKRATSQDITAMAREILEELLKRMDIHAYVAVVTSRVPDQQGVSEEETITYHVEGADEQAMGLMIGRRGETLQSLQFLLNVLVQKRTRNWPHVVVDVGNYRQRRREFLEGLAHRIAEQVSKSGRAIMLEPMAAYERRIVHLALRSEKSIYTQSLGEGENRKVVIHPKVS